VAAAQGLNEGVLVDGLASADVVEDAAGFHTRQALGGDEGFGGLAAGEDVEDVIGGGEDRVELRFGDRFDRFFAGRIAPQRDQVHAEGGEQLNDPAGDGAEGEEQDCLPGQQARLPSELVGGPGFGALLIDDRRRQLSRQSVDHRDDMLGAGLFIDR
jgi:hypothetical protein